MSITVPRIMQTTTLRGLARFHGRHRGRGQRYIAAMSLSSPPAAASETAFGLLQAIRGPEDKSSDSSNIGRVLSASGGLARISAEGPASVGCSVDLGDGSRAMMLQFDRKGAIVAPLSPRLPKAGTAASIGEPLSVRIRAEDILSANGVVFKSVVDVLGSEDAAVSSACGVLRLPSMPSPARRRPVTQRLPSGLAAAEALLPLGVGQRVGLIGPAGTGKSTAARMLLASQPESTICIYAAQRPLQHLQKELQGSVTAPLMVVHADPMQDSLAARYLLPICALHLASQLRASHRHVVLVLDDLVAFAAAAAEIELGSGMGSRGPLPLTVPHVLGAALDAGGTVMMDGGHEHSLSVVAVLDLEPDDELPSALRNLCRGVEPSLDVCLRFSGQLATKRVMPAIDPKELLPCGFAPTFQAPLLRLLRAELKAALQSGYEQEQRIELSRQLGLHLEIDEEEDIVNSDTARALLAHRSPRSLPELVVLLSAALIYRFPGRRPSPSAVAEFQDAVVDVIQRSHPRLWDSLESLETMSESDAASTLRKLGEALFLHRFDFRLTRPEL